MPSSCTLAPPEVRLDTSLELLLERLAVDAQPGVLATVVATSGSTYRKSGARMLFLADGSYVGLLTGGCFESDLTLHAQQVLASGQTRAIEYDLRGPDDELFGVGAGCEGAMRVLLEPAGPRGRAMPALQAAARLSAAGIPAVLLAVHEGGDDALGTYGAESPLPAAFIAATEQALEEAASRETLLVADGQRTRAFVQFLAPLPHLLVCGAGPDAQPVVAIARALGWRVTVVDHRPGYALAARFPGADVRWSEARLLRASVELAGCHAVVVMSHHLLSDAAYLRELAESELPAYIGLLGPAARRQRLAQEIGPVMEELESRIRGPIGIDIGAVTPEGIALAIIGQIHAWLAGRGALARAMRSG